MAVDTVKLRSSEIDEGTASMLERQCVLKQGMLIETGEILYEITSGNLEGSWDSRISFKVNREDWVTVGGRLDLVPCKPFVTVECSLHKFFYGQNVYGNPVGFQGLCRMFINLLGELLHDGEGLDEANPAFHLFASADQWQVRRVDWAEMFRLSQGAQAEFFRALKNCKFPRRALKEAKYDTAVHFPGKFTTLRIYGKGREFKEHEWSRLRRALTQYLMRQVGEARHDKSMKVVWDYTAHTYIEKKLSALQRLANNRLRAEVQINADKLHHDWEGRYPLVSEVTDEYLIQVFEKDMFKLLKEGRSEMETVRTYDLVKARLNDLYGKRSANNLLAFWMQMAARGEEAIRPEYSKSQFYDNRKKLVDAGISWNSSDVFIVPGDTALPRDFKPLPADPRRCVRPISANSIFNLCPVEYLQLKKAA